MSAARSPRGRAALFLTAAFLGTAGSFNRSAQRRHQVNHVALGCFFVLAEDNGVTEPLLLY